MAIGPNSKIALWTLTPNGLVVARRLQDKWPNAVLLGSRRLFDHGFIRLSDAIAEHFATFEGHIFIMATGIVVRSIAPLLKHKTMDPAMVVVDDRGEFAISLVSGHLGGGNALTRLTANDLGAIPVITTATDVNHKPAIDLLAAEQKLKIENPECIKTINMALLTGERFGLHDPQGWLRDKLPHDVAFDADAAVFTATADHEDVPPAVWIDDTTSSAMSTSTLVLRPPSLVAGIGCNRNTPKQEIHEFLLNTMARHGLSCTSLCALASIDLKADEAGLCALAADLGVPMQLFTRDELASAEDIPNPSAMVTKHVGVPSVCEAAAILASQRGRLIVPKHNTPNVTVAIARKASVSSA